MMTDKRRQELDEAAVIMLKDSSGNSIRWRTNNLIESAYLFDKLQEHGPTHVENSAPGVYEVVHVTRRSPVR